MWTHMMEWGGNWGSDWDLFGLMHLLWWVVVLLAVIALLRWAVGRDARGLRTPEKDRALDILRERYARGEIEQAEFEQRKRDLCG
ncbi:SHOCT domain-containing protein [Polaromonas naphthalenivorans]|nr:SHOCT domain-containing protein [Polaromonas naphthalenivorans]